MHVRLYDAQEILIWKLLEQKQDEFDVENGASLYNN